MGNVFPIQIWDRGPNFLFFDKNSAKIGCFEKSYIFIGFVNNVSLLMRKLSLLRSGGGGKLSPSTKTEKTLVLMQVIIGQWSHFCTRSCFQTTVRPLWSGQLTDDNCVLVTMCACVLRILSVYNLQRLFLPDLLRLRPHDGTWALWVASVTSEHSFLRLTIRLLIPDVKKRVFLFASFNHCEQHQVHAKLN